MPPASVSPKIGDESPSTARRGRKPRIGPIIFSFLCTTRTHIFTNSVVFATVKLYLQLFVCGYSKGVWYTEHPCPFLDITSHGNKTVFTLAGYQSMTIVFKPEK